MRLPDFAARHPRAILLIWLAVMLASVLPALRLDAALTPGGFTNPRSEAIRALHEIERGFHAAPNQVVVVVDGATPVTSATLDALGDKLRALGASEVETPRAHPKWESADRKTAVVVAGFEGDNTAVQNKTPRMQKELSKLTSSKVYVTGQPALDFELAVHSKEDATRAELIVFPVLIIVLLLVFRSLAAAVLPLLMAGMSLAVSSAAGYLVTRVTDVSTLYSNIVSMIGLAVAVDYSLFIIKRYREEVDTGADRGAALSTAYRTAGRSVLFSGIAVAIALCSLFIPRLMAFTSIGLGGVLVTLVALLATMTALPALLALLGQHVEWGRIPARRSSHERAEGPTPLSRGPAAAMAGVGVLVLLAVSAPILGLSLQSPVASASVLPKGDPARTGLDVVSSKLAAHDLFPLQIVITPRDKGDWRDVLAATQQLSDSARARPNVASVSSVSMLGLSEAQLERALAAEGSERLSSLWQADGNHPISRVIVNPATNPDSAATHSLVRDLRASAEIRSANVDVQVTGATAQGLDFDAALEASIPWIVAAVFALTLLMLAVAFRSITLPILALAFNGLVVIASLGILTLVLKSLGEDHMNSVTPVLLFAVLFGLSMDYMVIIVSRIIEEYRRGVSFDRAVVQGTRQTRSMINSAAVIMVAVFASFTSAQVSIVREIGVGLGIAVILDAALIRMVIMPGILRLIGPRLLGLGRPHALPVREAEGIRRVGAQAR